jgi:hypothetical protein
MTVTIKDSLGHHHGVAAAAEMYNILEFFCKDVTGIDNTRYMGILGDTQGLCFSYIILAEVKMFGVFIYN